MVDRRRFLTAAGWAAAAGWIPSRLFAHDMKAMKTMPAGQVGNGLCMHAMGDTTHMPGLVDPAKLAPFVDVLPLPPVLRPGKGQVLQVRMGQSTQKLHRDLPPTTLWTYGGISLGPPSKRMRACRSMWSGTTACRRSISCRWITPSAVRRPTSPRCAPSFICMVQRCRTRMTVIPKTGMCPVSRGATITRMGRKRPRSGTTTTRWASTGSTCMRG